MMPLKINKFAVYLFLAILAPWFMIAFLKGRHLRLEFYLDNLVFLSALSLILIGPVILFEKVFSEPRLRILMCFLIFSLYVLVTTVIITVSVFSYGFD